MKIIITGGAGFIASHITDRYISLGHEVVIIDNMSSGKLENINPNAKIYKVDIKDESIIDIFMNEKPDILNHHAAQMDVRVSVNNPKFDAQENIIGSLNLYEACAKSNVKKIVFASSGGTVYGEQFEFPADETHPLNPCSPYGISKMVNEKYLFYYKAVYGIDYVALRYGNVYGPRQNPNGEAGVVAIFVQRLLTDKEAIINGDGLITRDYIFVDDVVNANEVSLKNEVSGIFNVTTGIETNVNHIFRVLKTLLNSNQLEIHGEAKAGEQRRSVCSPRKFLQYGWEPKVKFDNGVIETVEFFKNKLKNK